MFDNLPTQTGPGWTLHHNDCVQQMHTLPENSIDAIVTDPPYHLTSIVARYGKTGLDGNGTNETRARNRSDGMARLAGGFMGKQWDGGDVAFRVETWRAAYRLLKPGGYILAFASSRGYHRMAVAIEDAGFITHPLIGWVFGSGFPKATDVTRFLPPECAAQWQGWYYGGQVRKPALEPIYVGRKPFSERNGALNILRWGVGAVNIDGCRVAGAGGGTRCNNRADTGKCLGHPDRSGTAFGLTYHGPEGDAELGRWPANLMHDGSDEVMALFPNAARFFNTFYYHPKANARDRLGSKHPTVKPMSLMRDLVRHATPLGGTVLDPFAGTGSTLKAAVMEGMKAVGIEADAMSVVDTLWRMRHDIQSR